MHATANFGSEGGTAGTIPGRVAAKIFLFLTFFQFVNTSVIDELALLDFTQKAYD